MKKTVLAILTGLLLTVSVPLAQASAAPYCGITWGSLPKSAGALGVTPLINVRTGEHACYDRMVFDLNGPATGYSVRYVNSLVADGSGQPIAVKGGAILKIVILSPSYDQAGHTTYPGVVGQALPGVNLTGYQTFRDAKFAGSFEGQTTIGLGVRARLPFTVSILSNRIVVDVAHHW